LTEDTDEMVLPVESRASDQPRASIFAGSRLETAASIRSSDDSLADNPAETRFRILDCRWSRVL